LGKVGRKEGLEEGRKEGLLLSVITLVVIGIKHIIEENFKKKQ
jgi:hypothetical protein